MVVIYQQELAIPVDCYDSVVALRVHGNQYIILYKLLLNHICIVMSM